MGKQRSKKAQSVQTNTHVQTLLMQEYGLTKSEVKRLYEKITEDIRPKVEEEIMSLKAKVEKYKPRSVKAYVFQSLMNLIERLQPEDAEIIEEVPATPEKKRVELYTEEDLGHFDMFMELASGAVSKQNFHTWIECLKLHQVKGNTIVLQAPSRIVVEEIERNLLKNIIHAFYAAFGEDAKIEYIIGN